MTSANERQYQIPFCQVLAAEGETVRYVSTHGPFEKGKDIVTQTSSGEVHAYQLKAGNIGLAEWREIHGEIVNLVELAIEFPGESPIINFVPYLVTNGELTDAALEQIRVSNESWSQRGIHKKLHVVQRRELADRFRSSHGAYLPHQLQEFRVFLELILRDGASPASKERAAQLVEHILPTEKQLSKPLEVGRAAASIVLLTAYVTGAATIASNYWAVFEYWVLAASYILCLIEKCAASEKQCEISFGLCEMAAEAALASLTDECETKSNLVQGLALTDGHTYKSRVTILLGLLSGLNLFRRLRGGKRTKEDLIRTFVEQHLKEISLWGESAVPFLYLTALNIEESAKQTIAERLAIQIIRDVSRVNGLPGVGRGIPNPYYPAEEALRLNFGLDLLNLEQFVGLSYSIAPLVDFLARRWRRQALASLWYSITRISLVSYQPANFAEWYRWKSTDGALESHLPAEPQSWESLREEAEALDIGDLPPSLRKRPAFALWFVLVYPHRFTRCTAKLIEEALAPSVPQT